MRYFIDIENQVLPLKSWLRDNHSTIKNYIFVEDDTTHQIVSKFKKLGWVLIEKNDFKILSKSRDIDEKIKNELKSVNSSEFDRFVLKQTQTNKFSQEEKYLKMYLTSIQKLNELNVLNTRRDFTSQIGEWLICNLVGGKQSDNGIQKDWDIIADEKKIQVKAHSKSESTTARWTEIKYDEKSDLDYLAIIVFDTTYNIEEFYFALWHDCIPLIKKQKHRSVINWRDLKNFQVDLKRHDELTLIQMFLNI